VIRAEALRDLTGLGWTTEDRRANIERLFARASMKWRLYFTKRFLCQDL
jgi:hypothetical protein